MYQLASPVTELRSPSECVRSRKLVINRVPSAIGVICVRINYRVPRHHFSGTAVETATVTTIAAY